MVTPAVYTGARPQRRTRSPQHPFAIRQPPYAICPFFIAPVIAGETMNSLLLQARVVTDPLINHITGWHLEYYFFYVKLSDLPIFRSEDNMKALIDPAYDWADIITAAGGTTANTRQFFAGGAGQVNYVQLCLEQVVNWYFRDEGEVAGDHTLSYVSETFYMAGYNRRTPLESVVLEDDYDTQDVSVTVGVDDIITMSELHSAQQMYEALRMANLVEMQYEDWLKAYGVAVPEVADHKPELLRYVKLWQYPSNTIDPTNGTPRAAISWSVAERADKARFMKEPGFLFGVTLTRPKMYLGNVTGSFTSSLNSALAWLPPGMINDVRLRMRNLPDAVGPLGGVVTDADGYRFDIGDLFTYGEEFRSTNATTNGQASPVIRMTPALALPGASLVNTDYPDVADDLYNLFVDEDAAANSVYTRQDGVVSLNIASPVTNVSPRGGPRTVML